jgi:hypothetical protein
LEQLLARADGPVSEAASLTKSITDLERRELLRAAGRVESRRRFKGGQVVATDDKDREFLFIDESGKSLPTGSKYFALGGVAMSGREASRYRRRANAIKRRFIGTSDVTFHEPHMRQRREPFLFGGDTTRQSAFDRALNRLVSGTSFVAFGVGIRKTAFEAFGQRQDDPYLPTDMYAVAVQLLLERYVDYRATSGGPRSLSRVVFESQGPKEDATHQRDFADVLLDGTQWVPDSAFRQWLETGVIFRPKLGSHPLELADMLSRDLYEWLAAECTSSPGRWSVFTAKAYCRGDRQMGKFGFKVFPAEDIDDRIQAHRRQAGRRR